MKLEPRWRAHPQAPQPQAVVAWGPLAALLLQRLKPLGATELQALRLSFASQLLCVCGDAAALPWLDGVGYAAPAAESVPLWLPTAQTPDVAPDLLYRALFARYRRTPLLLWPEPRWVLPLDRLQTASPEVIAQIEQHFAAARESAPA